MDEQDVVRLAVRAGLLVHTWPASHPVGICDLKKQQAAWREPIRKDLHGSHQVGRVLAIVDRPGQGGDDVIAADLRERLHPLQPDPRRSKPLSGGVHHPRGGVRSISVDAVGERQFEKHAGAASDIEETRARAVKAGDLLKDESVVVLVVAWRRVKVVAVGVGLEELMHVSRCPVAQARRP